MFYILHQPDGLEEVEKNILPLLEGREYQMLTFPPGKNLSPAENAVFITYLDDENLREFIPFAAEKKWASGVLPHPGNKYTSKGLGISEKTEEAVAEILKNEETHNLDILFCNRNTHIK